jgi:hypothetical protein
MFAPVINLVLIFILTQLPLFVVRKTQKFLHSAFLCYNNLISCLMFILGAAFIPATSLSVKRKEGVHMLTRDEAWKLLTEYNQDPFHLRHALTVEGVMRYFARELGYGAEEDFWGIVGLLHDLDFEKFPEQHCKKEKEIMEGLHLDPKLIHAVACHGYGICIDLSRSTRWKRFSSPATSSPVSSAPAP